MLKHLLSDLHGFFHRPIADRKVKRRHSRRRERALAFEALESRELMAIMPLQNLSVADDTGEKPQSKVFEHAGQWWTVMPNSSGTWVFRLDGTSWAPTQRITTSKSVHADVKLVGDVAHVLLYNGTSSQLASLQYDAGPDNRFEPWSLRPQLVSVPMASGVETATLEVDSTGRMWVAYDVSSTVEVRYSDGNYSTWSAPIVVASGINSDDISSIIAMPNGTIGVFWSNQSSDRFGFRVHQDWAAPQTWLAPEVPAGQSALNVGGGMADDHVNVAVASDGTLYAAVKTSYDKSGYPKIALLVRRPNGTWDNLYNVDNGGTRPIVVVNEAAGKLIVAYTTNEGGGDIVYRESPLGNIALGPRQTLIDASVNNVTSTKHTSTNEIVFLAASRGSARGVLFRYDTISPNSAPLVSAGVDQTIVLGSLVALDGTATDDGQPSPGNLMTSWTMFAGPGSVTFGNSSAVDTTASFSAAGTYVLRLTANDGQLSRFDDVTITVTAPTVPNDPPPPPPPPPEPTDAPVEIAFQDGLFPSLAYAGTSDTKLNSESKSRNYGVAQSFEVDGRPDVAGLFRWDVSVIPATSSVVSAAIELNTLTDTDHNFELYALQRAWDELSATWNQYAAGQYWGTAGASGSGDRGSQVLGQLGPTGTGTHRIALNDAGIAAVQAWINQPWLNHGIIIQDYASSDGVQISSSEATNAWLRPKLIINYQPTGELVQHEPLAEASIATNTAPTVNAGADVAVTLGQAVNLSAVVSDDGLPSGTLQLLWTNLSGPGSVTFANPTAASTTVEFSLAGTYVLRLTASDGELDGFDELTVSVTEPVVTTSTTRTSVRPSGRGIAWSG